MLRTALTLVCALIIAGVGAGSALAVEPPLATQPYNQAQYEQALKDLIRRAVTATPDPAVPPTVTSPEKAKAGLWRARAVARVLPALRVMGPIALAASAPQAVMGYKVTISGVVNYFKYGTFGLGLQAAQPGVSQVSNVVRTGYSFAGGCVQGWTNFTGINFSANCASTTPASPLNDGWNVTWTGTRVSDGAAISDGALWKCTHETHSYCVVYSLWATYNHLSTALQVPGAVEVPVYSYANSPTTTLYLQKRIYATSAESPDRKLELLEDPQVGGSDPSWYTDLPAPQKKTATYTRPSDAGTTTADVTAARAELDVSDPDVRIYINTALDPNYDPDVAPSVEMPNCVGLTEAQCDALLDGLGHEGTRTYVELELGTAVVTQPAGAVVTQSKAAGVTFPGEEAVTFTKNPPVEGMPFTLPQPTVNETYTAYLARLEALGWLGSATSTVLADALEGYGPLAPARITYTQGTTTRTLDPLRWPSLAPVLAKGTDVTVRYNPDTAPEAPGETGTIPTAPPSTVAPEPYEAPPALDFSPLNPSEVCDKFPFGVVCWIADQLEIMFLQTPDAPSIDVTIPAFDAGFAVIPAIPFAFDFGDPKYAGAFDTYISVVRAALAFFLWLGGLWFLGTRLLNVRGAQDTEGY